MNQTTLLTKNEIDAIIKELANQILSKHKDEEDLVLIGIKRRGADISSRIRGIIENTSGRKIPLGELDINLYRDDWTKLSGKPVIAASHIPMSLDDKIVILVDDVLFSGRTIRAALEALFDYGRPKKVELLTLIDRGHREMPICSDYTGFQIHTNKNAHVDVLLEERDGTDAVILH